MKKIKSVFYWTMFVMMLTASACTFMYFLYNIYSGNGAVGAILFSLLGFFIFTGVTAKIANID